MTKQFDVAILGATGVVGEALLSILEQRAFPVGKLYPLASARSVGETVMFKGQVLQVEDAASFDFNKVQLAFFSAGASVSADYAPIAALAGCVVIDNTSQFRYDADIPLVVPEVNPEDISLYKNRHIIANPNCSTIQLVVALKPIYDAAGITRVNVATYQSVSGTGKQAVEELTLQTKAILAKQTPESAVYPIPIAFNLIPHIDIFEENGYTREEMKIVRETKKILHDETILVNPTAVRVPVYFGHSEAVHIETKTKLTKAQATQLLERAPGILIKDEQTDGQYPSPRVEGDGKDAVYVGRIREDISHPMGLNLWVVADNIRKGAALNSIQIAEILVRDYL